MRGRETEVGVWREVDGVELTTPVEWVFVGRRREVTASYVEGEALDPEGGVCTLSAEETEAQRVAVEEARYALERRLQDEREAEAGDAREAARNR